MIKEIDSHYQQDFKAKNNLLFASFQFLMVFLFVIFAIIILSFFSGELLLFYENFWILIGTLILLVISVFYSLITSILTVKKKRPIKIDIKKFEQKYRKYETKSSFHAFFSFFNVIVGLFFLYFAVIFTFNWEGVIGLGLELQIIVLILLYGNSILHLGTSFLWIARFLKYFKKKVEIKLTKGMISLGFSFLFLLSSISVSILISVNIPKWSPGIISYQDLFKAGETYEGPEGEPPITGYRIPALLWLPGDTLLAFAEGRENPWNDGGNIDIVLRRSLDGGDTWEPLQIIAEYGDRTAGNPCPVYDADTGIIHLVFNHDNKEVWVTTSSNKGKTWSTPRDITNGLGLNGEFHGCGPGIGIQKKIGNHKGRLIIPSYGGGKDGSHIIYSDDHGNQWHAGNGAGCGGECQVVEDFLGGLYLNMRSSPNRIIARSSDGGESWSTCYSDPALPDVPCQAAVYRFTSIYDTGKNRLLYCGPSYRVRGHYTIRMSYDEGISWSVAKEIYSGSSAYGQMVVLSDHTIVLLFERGTIDYRESITLVKFDINWLTNGQEQI